MRHFPANVAVRCRSCGSEIPFFRPDNQVSELSLKCSKCERRGIYAAVDVRPFNGDVSVKPSHLDKKPKAMAWLFG